MRIKTITCHDVYNYGASLQACALQHYLSQAGHDVEIIDYKPPYLSNHHKLTAISNPKFDKPVIRWMYVMAKLPERLLALKRKKSFDMFRKKYLTITPVRYRNNEELKQQLPQADAYICGSDQIWNSFFQNGKDPAFYLDFVPDDKIKISYAASFATERINESLQQFVREKVNRLNAISVRETSGVGILKKLGIENAVQVMDPVFLLPADYWKNMFIEKIDENYIFVYDFDNNPHIADWIKKLSVQKRYKIYSMNETISYSDKNFWKESPEKFLSLIYNAQYVVSNSFHACAFSLIFEKQFFVINRIEKINTRMRDLMQLFDLEHRIINKDADLKKIGNIDYSRINPLIEQEIEKSKQFIENSLNLCR